MPKTLGEIERAAHREAAEIGAGIEAEPFFTDLQAIRQAAADNSFTDDTRRKLEGVLAMAEAGFRGFSGDLTAVGCSPWSARAYADRMGVADGV